MTDYESWANGIGPIIRTRCQSLGILGSDLARQVRTPQAHISRIMHSKVIPGVVLLARIADVLDVEPRQLLPSRATDDPSKADTEVLPVLPDPTEGGA